MNNISIIFLIILLLSFSCNDDNRIEDKFPGTYPCCFQSYINNALSNPPSTPRIKIEKYYYDNQYVYIISSALSQMPDYLGYVKNENCEIVCEFGGIAGVMCPEWKNTEFIEVVWEDPR